MNPIAVELIKFGMQFLISMAKQNNLTEAELDQFYVDAKNKFGQSDPNSLPDV
jgi:hypothetical protein